MPSIELLPIRAERDFVVTESNILLFKFFAKFYEFFFPEPN